MSNNEITKHNVVNTEVSAEEIMKKYDKDSKSRNFTGVFKIIYDVVFMAFSLFVIILALMIQGATEFTKLPLFLGLIMFLGYIKFPACNKDAEKENYLPPYDIVLALLSLGTCLYYVIKQNDIIYMGGYIEYEQIIVGILAILLLFELCRRAIGIPLMVVAGGFLIYAIIWLFDNNPNTVINNLIYNLYYNLNCGIYSTPVSVCCSFIVIFIIFGSFLEKTGVGGFFVDLANSLVGSQAGGPAKVAVISSALEGMYSGSSVANTVGSGSITIPVMKSAGYKPEFAAAVEAAASTGGQIMPPIMGAAAFLMSQITGVSYATIVVCAILPAILYFVGIFIMVHLEAKKMGLKGLPKESIPNFFKLILKKGYLLIPIVALVICMNRFTPALSASFAIMFA
ncbi:MAG: TRAP transporter fused permease subunit, partial [Clostridia bacterium]|nr:TRAP transporter fused permease subunit [Clostridia bacterium]